MKGDVHDPGKYRKYRGITLLSQVLKLLERVLDGRIRKTLNARLVKNSTDSERGEEPRMGCSH